MTAHDEYEGWIDHKQYVEIEHPAFVALHDLNTILGLSISHNVMKTSSNERLNLIAGSNIPNTLDKFFYLKDTKYKLEGEFVKPAKHKFRREVTETAMFYLNAPYLWGGKSVFGIDCSGLTQMVYKLNGYKIHRDASQQALEGEPLSFIEESEAGDLAFFDNDEGNIIHVGIIMENNYIIHASGKVRIDRLDHLGIYNPELNKHTHKLRVIKKII